MKLWAITNGEFYDDYSVLAICTSESKANELKLEWEEKEKSTIFRRQANVIEIDSDELEQNL